MPGRASNESMFAVLMLRATCDFIGRASGGADVREVQLDDAIVAIKSSDDNKVKQFDKPFIAGALFPCAKC